MGDPVPGAKWSRTSKVNEMVKDVSSAVYCIFCHDPHAAKPRIVRDGLIHALTRDPRALEMADSAEFERANYARWTTGRHCIPSCRPARRHIPSSHLPSRASNVSPRWRGTINGPIDFDSEPGRGGRFWLELPVSAT